MMLHIGGRMTECSFCKKKAEYHSVSSEGIFYCDGCMDKKESAQANEWISVEENSMPNYDWVLVCTNKRFDSPICFAKRYPISEMYPQGQWVFWDDNHYGPYCGDSFSGMDIEEITHWMPLPQLPQDIDAEKRIKND